MKSDQTILEEAKEKVDCPVCGKSCYNDTYRVFGCPHCQHTDKTGYNEERRCRLGLEILKKHIRGDFYSTGHLHMKIYEAMEEYASQFRGEMTTK